jgi:hypothetical protein
MLKSYMLATKSAGEEERCDTPPGTGRRPMPVPQMRRLVSRQHPSLARRQRGEHDGSDHGSPAQSLQGECLKSRVVDDDDEDTLRPLLTAAPVDMADDLRVNEHLTVSPGVPRT